MTNRQIALIAAVIDLQHNYSATLEKTLDLALKYATWLDGQDRAEFLANHQPGFR